MYTFANAIIGNDIAEILNRYMAHSDIKAVRYEAIFQPVWDEYVRKARQASFLFERSFMDYHADRFTDASLIVRNAKNKILALLPACESRKEE